MQWQFYDQRAKDKRVWERCLGVSIIIRAAGTVSVFEYALNGESRYLPGEMG